MTNIFRMKNILYLLLILAFAGCKREKNKEYYQTFEKDTWQRYNILRFYIPVTKSDKPVDIYLYARFTGAFEYESLSFNMVMSTPSGEERIKESGIKVKSPDGSFLIPKNNDRYEGIVLMKKELYFNEKGILKIEIENLTPRLETRGISGIGIRLVNP